MTDIDYGIVKIKLADVIAERGISKNKVMRLADMQRTQLNQYCKGNVTRLDTAVLARLCTALDCRIEDIIEFIPPEQANEKESTTHVNL